MSSPSQKSERRAPARLVEATEKQQAEPALGAPSQEKSVARAPCRVDPVNTLLRGDANKVRTDVTQILETAGHVMGGFILSSACSIAPPVNPENIKLMVDLCRRFKP